MVGNIYLYFMCNAIDLFFQDGGPKYPDTLTVFGKGESAEIHGHKFGIYRIVPGLLQNNKPVWKHIMANSYIFFFGTFYGGKMKLFKAYY